MLKSGFPFFLAKVEKMKTKVQGEKAKNQGETLVQSGECKMCFCMHKNLFTLSGRSQPTFPSAINDSPL